MKVTVGCAHETAVIGDEQDAEEDWDKHNSGQDLRPVKHFYGVDAEEIDRRGYKDSDGDRNEKEAGAPGRHGESGFPAKRL